MERVKGYPKGVHLRLTRESIDIYVYTYTYIYIYIYIYIDR